jgi:hypothetical protein
MNGVFRGAALGATLALSPAAHAGDDEPAPASHDELEVEIGAKLQSDLRFRVEDKSVGGPYDRRALPVGIDRNENLAGLRLTARYGKVSAKADIDFVLYGFAREIESLEDLSLREKLDPYRFDVHSLYINVEDFLLDDLDLRVGQQLVSWGVGDQFNPTNNLNADDVEDPLQFGDQQGNFMVRLDYWIDPAWSITGVVVPVFRPALLPRSSPLALARADRLPMHDESLRLRIHAEQAAASRLGRQSVIVRSVTPELPELTLDNLQVGYRIGGALGEQDVALSYYLGRHDFPVMRRTHTEQRCLVAGPNGCDEGLLENAVTLEYPRIHAYGFNMAGEVGWLEALSDVFNAVGYRIEAALVVPEPSTAALSNGALSVAGFGIPAGTYDYNGRAAGLGAEPEVVGDTPFFKWAIGLDYSFGEHVYANVQWVHGLADEIGGDHLYHGGDAVRAGGVDPALSDAAVLQCARIRLDGTRCATETLKPRIGDYLVLGVDVRLLRQRLLLRLFGILDLTGVDLTRFDEASGERVREHRSLFSEEGFSAVVYPEIDYNFQNGLELGAGALVLLGDDDTKFGDPAAGGSLVWTRARYSF